METGLTASALQALPIRTVMSFSQELIHEPSDQLQAPLFTISAHVFRLDPDTKKSWLPLSKHSVSVSFYYDSAKFIYTILSRENSKVLINSTITSGMSFTKTSHKFGQWSDAKVNTIYGLGFSSENDVRKFAEKFKEMKNNVRCGTPPATPRNPANIRTNHVSDPSPATSMKSMSSNSTTSYEDDRQSPGSHRSSSSSSESQMKYENDRLKKALAQSSLNAKKWEAEFQTLKNNNARLTAALQESAVNVEKWKEQLHNYKEDNSRLRKKVANLSNNNKSCDCEMEQRLEEAEMKLKRKEEDLNKLSKHSSEEVNILREKNTQLTKKVKQLEEASSSDDINHHKQLTNSLDDHKIKQLIEIKNDMETRLREMDSLQHRMGSVLKS